MFAFLADYDVSCAHILFVFVISILLINFLVALLANSVSEVSSSSLFLDQVFYCKERCRLFDITDP